VKWIDTNGGPFIVLPFEHRAAWDGSEPPANNRVVRAEFRWDGQKLATDYDEACDRTGAPDWFGFLERRDFTALAIPRGSLTSSPRKDGALLVHCDTAPSQAHANKLVRTKLATDPDVKWRRARTRVTTPGKLVACDAAYPGRSQPRAMTLAIELAKGTYAVAVADYDPDDETRMTLFRLTRR